MPARTDAVLPQVSCSHGNRHRPRNPGRVAAISACGLAEFNSRLDLFLARALTEANIATGESFHSAGRIIVFAVGGSK